MPLPHFDKKSDVNVFPEITLIFPVLQFFLMTIILCFFSFSLAHYKNIFMILNIS